MEKAVIISDPEGPGQAFASGIYDYILGREAGEYPIEHTSITKKTFKDGEFKFHIDGNLRRKLCFYIHDSNKAAPEWLAELPLALHAVHYASPAETNVVFPFMRFTRQDVKDESRVSVNSVVVADICSNYADRVMTMDLHSPQQPGFYKCQFDNLYSFPAVVSHLVKEHPDQLENLVIVSPDAGGVTRAESFRKRLNRENFASGLVVCTKNRNGQANEVESIEVLGSVDGKNCLVVDDINDTGTTSIKVGGALKEKGATTIRLYTTHGLYTDGTKKFSVYETVYGSDTLIVEPFENLETISLIPVFGEAIYRTIEGKSLSGLFRTDQ